MSRCTQEPRTFQDLRVDTNMAQAAFRLFPVRGRSVSKLRFLVAICLMMLFRGAEVRPARRSPVPGDGAFSQP